MKKQNKNHTRWLICGALVLLLALVCSMALADVEVNEQTFPDPVFRDYVITEFAGGDNLLTDEEIAAVTNLNLVYKTASKITNAQGIEYFTALEYLNFGFSKVTALDLSSNTKLMSVFLVSSNQLASLNISNCSNLQFLNISSCPISSLDLTPCSYLEELLCMDTDLASLDLSKNTKLFSLVCCATRIKTLDLCKTPLLKDLVTSVQQPEDKGDYYAYNNGSAELQVDKDVKLVTEIQVSGITLSKAKETLTRTGKTPKPTLTLAANIAPADAKNQSVTWSSNKPTVAKVDANGKVTALKAGTAIITCEAKDGSGVKATCTVTVKDAKVTKLTLNKTKAKLKVGKTLQLKVKKFTPASPLNTKVKWTTSDKKVATVDKNGKVKAKKAGKVVITCTSRDNKKITAKCTITVK